MRLKMMMKRFRIGPGLVALFLASAPLLGGCAPKVVGAGATVGIAVGQKSSLKDAVSDVPMQTPRLNDVYLPT